MSGNRGGPKRTNRFNMFLSEDELVMLGELARVNGLTRSDKLRQLLRDRFAKFAQERGMTTAQLLERERGIEVAAFGRLAGELSEKELKEIARQVPPVQESERDS